MYTSFFTNGEFNIVDSLLAPPFSLSMPKTSSILAIGNPIIDVTAEIDKECVQNYGLKFGEISFATPQNEGYFNDIENKSEVIYTPGGCAQNTLRVASWCLNKDPHNTEKNYKLTMLGSVGEDIYKNRVINSLTEYGVKPLIEIISNMKTSRCAIGIGINNKQKCVLPQIRASNFLSENFVKQNGQEILSHEALLIEGYFLKEKFELCKKLCEEFIKLKRLIILTLSDQYMVEFHNDKILEIANVSNIIVGSFSAGEILADGKGKNMQETFEKIHKKLSPKNRLLVITGGCQGAFCSLFNYQKNKLEFLLQDFPQQIKSSDIIDSNGAGDAFFGGFLSQLMQGKSLLACCRCGNEIAKVVLKNIGCTFPINTKLSFNY